MVSGAATRRPADPNLKERRRYGGASQRIINRKHRNLPCERLAGHGVYSMILFFIFYIFIHLNQGLDQRNTCVSCWERPANFPHLSHFFVSFICTHTENRPFIFTFKIELIVHQDTYIRKDMKRRKISLCSSSTSG